MPGDGRPVAAEPRGAARQATGARVQTSETLHAMQAVLVDMDGTLCETEPSWMEAEHAMAEAYGAPWTRADGLALVGNNLLDSGVYIKQRMGLVQSPAEVVDELVDRVVRVV